MLAWHPMGFGVIEAWAHQDRTWAACVCRIENWPGEFRVTTKRSHTSGLSVATVRLASTEFDLAAAKQVAEAIEAACPAQPRTEPVPQPAEVLQWRAPAAPRCEFRHAWHPGLDDADLCACGRVSRGWARTHGLITVAS